MESEDIEVRMVPKLKRYQNADYLKFVRSQGCLICSRPAEAHHVRRIRWAAGTGQKPHDYVSIPFCREHHTSENEKYINVELAIIDLLMRYIESKK